MGQLLAVMFQDVDAAGDVCRKLRGLQAKHLVALDDACVAERDERGTLHLTQAIGRLAVDLPKEFWHDAVDHILSPGESSSEDAAPTAWLPRHFVRAVAGALRPKTSALFILVEEASADALVESLKGHEGRILQTALPDATRETLSRTLAPPPTVPAAEDLRSMVFHTEQQKTQERSHSREADQAERRKRAEALKAVKLSYHDIREVLRQCVTAAKRGETEVIAYRFPSEVCSDGGRAINNTMPTWPDTLAGQPRELFDYWRQTLQPAGYRLRAEVLDFPDGMPGDVGFIFAWA